MRRPGLGLGIELSVGINAQTGVGGSVSFNTSFSDINTGLFGTDTSKSGGGSTSQTTAERIFSDLRAIDTTKELSNVTGETSDLSKTSEETTEQLKIDEEGILQLIDNILSGTSGLAEIFGAEQGAGLFGSSAAKSNTEDLLAKIAGELALVTGVKTTSGAGTTAVSGTSKETGDRLSITDKTASELATKTGTATGRSTLSQAQESSGILDSIGELFGGIF